MYYQKKKTPHKAGFAVEANALSYFFEVCCGRDDIAELAQFAVSAAVTKVHYQTQDHPDESNQESAGVNGDDHAGANNCTKN